MSLSRNFYASRKSRERRRRKGQIFLGCFDSRFRSRFKRIINFFFSSDYLLALLFTLCLPSTIPVCIPVPYIIPSLFLDCFVNMSAYYSAWNKRVKGQNTGSEGEGETCMRSLTERIVKRKYTLAKFKFISPNDS